MPDMLPVIIMSDLRLPPNFRLILSGASSVGKTWLCENLLRDTSCFREPVREIVWVYAKHTADQQLFDRLKSLPITFREGYPEKEIEDNTLFKSKTGKVLVLDDQFTSCYKNKALFDLFHIISHHQNISVILTGM